LSQWGQSKHSSLRLLAANKNSYETGAIERTQALTLTSST